MTTAELSEAGTESLTSGWAWMGRAIASAPGRGILSGILYAASFPTAGQGWLVWVALVPLLSLIERAGSRPLLYLSAWLGGLVFWVWSLQWLCELHPSAWIAWLALAVYLSLFWPLFLLLARSLVRVRVPLVIAVPTAWLACDYIQAFALSGFPWFYPAHSQYRFLALIQVSDLLGAWGVSALVVMGNAALLQITRIAERSARPNSAPFRASELAWPGVVVALLIASLGYGRYRLSQSQFAPGPEVVLLQSNFRQALKMGKRPQEIVATYERLLQNALARPAERESTHGSVVVWPETSYPWGFVGIDPDLKPEEVARAGRQIHPDWELADWLELRTETVRDLNSFSQMLGRPMIVGAVLYELHRDLGQKSNAALWIDGRTDRPRHYRKIHLVPFGEYVPLLRQLPWIKLLAPYEETNLPNLVSGGSPVWFDEGGIRYAPVICFEDTVPHLVRRFFVEQADGRAPDLILNISNDGWFNGTAEHEMHLATSIFRSIEHRAPLVRSSNMGYSAVVDGNGAIVALQPKKTEGVIRAIVPLDDRQSLYTRVGDILPQTCLTASIASIAWIVFFLPMSRFLWNPRTR
jgi:apolipoprotein N-acyltransferase